MLPADTGGTVAQDRARDRWRRQPGASSRPEWLRRSPADATSSPVRRTCAGARRDAEPSWCGAAQSLLASGRANRDDAAVFVSRATTLGTSTSRARMRISTRGACRHCGSAWPTRHLSSGRKPARSPYSPSGRLVLDVTAECPCPSDPRRWVVAGVDLGIIHPYALAAADQALLVSGRAIRAEERLHLADTKALARAMANGRRARSTCIESLAQAAGHSCAGPRSRFCTECARSRRGRADRFAWAIEHEVGTLLVGIPTASHVVDAGTTPEPPGGGHLAAHHLITRVSPMVAGRGVHPYPRFWALLRRTRSVRPRCSGRTGGALPVGRVATTGTGTSSVPATSPLVAAVQRRFEIVLMHDELAGAGSTDRTRSSHGRSGGLARQRAAPRRGGSRPSCRGRAPRCGCTVRS